MTLFSKFLQQKKNIDPLTYKSNNFWGNQVKLLLSFIEQKLLSLERLLLKLEKMFLEGDGISQGSLRQRRDLESSINDVTT